MSSPSQSICMLCMASSTDLLVAPCNQHYVCGDCVPSFFLQAIQHEASYPPKCCGAIFDLEEFYAYIEPDIVSEYQEKEKVYAIAPKDRVYCPNPTCGEWQDPQYFAENPDSMFGTKYSICQNLQCQEIICAECKISIKDNVDSHECEVDEEENVFKHEAENMGFKECKCGMMVELKEACNHMTCLCGHSFCFICTQPWTGIHSCPQYGTPRYDSQGYNQDGFHRITGLNRARRTRQEEIKFRQENKFLEQQVRLRGLQGRFHYGQRVMQGMIEELEQSVEISSRFSSFG